MTLVEKLKLINKPPIIPIQMGFAENSTELWNNFIFPRLPKKDVVLHWHKILTEYIKRSDATFALRFYNTAPKSEYEKLRRGFLTRTDKGYSFFILIIFMQRIISKWRWTNISLRWNKFFRLSIPDNFLLVSDLSLLKKKNLQQCLTNTILVLQLQAIKSRIFTTLELIIIQTASFYLCRTS